MLDGVLITLNFLKIKENKEKLGIEKNPIFQNDRIPLSVPFPGDGTTLSHAITKTNLENSHSLT
jgi:hypothetical protein